MHVSHRSAALPASESKLREEAWRNAPTIAEKFPQAGQFAIALTFRDPRGQERPTPRRQLYEPSMRAYFELRCPLRDCSGGGFDLNAPIRKMLAGDGSRTGHASCQGTRGREECRVELTYALMPTAESGGA